MGTELNAIWTSKTTTTTAPSDMILPTPPIHQADGELSTRRGQYFNHSHRAAPNTSTGVLQRSVVEGEQTQVSSSSFRVSTFFVCAYVYSQVESGKGELGKRRDVSEKKGGMGVQSFR